MLHKKKSQATTDYMVLFGIILIIIVLITFYTWKPKQDIILDRAESSLNTITEYANKVAELGPGNKMQVKIEIPPGVTRIDFGDNEVNMYIFNESGRETELHKPLKTVVSGFLDGEVSPGTYDLIFESLGTGVCDFRPGMREEDCYCHFPDTELEKPVFYGMGAEYLNKELACHVDGAPDPDACDSISVGYGDRLIGFRSNCRSNTGTVITGEVEYKVTNRLGQVVYNKTSYQHDNDSSGNPGYFNVTNADYTIQNSGELKLTATCYHECYYVTQNDELKATTEVPLTIPFGRIRTFLLDEFERKIYTDDYHYYLIDPLNNPINWHLGYGWVKTDIPFVIRTGFECVGGECINVDAALYHGGEAS